MKREGENDADAGGEGDGGRNEVEILAPIGPRGVVEGMFNE